MKKCILGFVTILLVVCLTLGACGEPEPTEPTTPTIPTGPSEILVGTSAGRALCM